MRALIMLPVLTALALAGCGSEQKTDEAKTKPGKTATGEGTLVKIKVPGMV